MRQIHVRQIDKRTKQLARAERTARRQHALIGLPPSRIDILTGVSGLTFPEAWPNRTEVAVGDIRVPVLGRRDFITNKKASGRERDLSDLRLLRPEV